MKERNSLQILITICVIIVILCTSILCYMCSRYESKLLSSTRYDTHVLDTWDIGETEHSRIRMIGASVQNVKTNNVYEVADESGRHWEVEMKALGPFDYLLLWIDDAGTPEDDSDDVVVKVWKDIH